MSAIEIRQIRDEDELAAALDVRRVVFIDEQGVTVEGDLDGRDHEALQLIALQDGHVIATCRVLLEGPLAKFGRLAVLPDKRGGGHLDACHLPVERRPALRAEAAA